MNGILNDTLLVKCLAIPTDLVLFVLWRAQMYLILFGPCALSDRGSCPKSLLFGPLLPSFGEMLTRLVVWQATSPPRRPSWVIRNRFNQLIGEKDEITSLSTQIGVPIGVLPPLDDRNGNVLELVIVERRWNDSLVCFLDLMDSNTRLVGVYGMCVVWIAPRRA